MNKKYELTDETKTVFRRTLHRIKALRDFTLSDGTIVHCGDLGGYVESERNLGHDDPAWIFDSACVLENALVFGNALVYSNARVFGNARVYGNARVSDNAWVYGNAWVSDNARVYGNAWVSGNARLRDQANVSRTDHYFVHGPCGGRDDFVTFYRTKDNTIWGSCGCFNGDINAFLRKVKETHGDNKHAKVYSTLAEAARLQIDLTPEEDQG